MIRLDYISCVLTIVSTILIGRRAWYGWIVAGANSAIICVIGLKTGQSGFIPANLFCLAIYGYNLVTWRAQAGATQSVPASDTLSGSQGIARTHERAIRQRDRVRPRRLRGRRKSVAAR